MIQMLPSEKKKLTKMANKESMHMEPSEIKRVVAIMMTAEIMEMRPATGKQAVMTPQEDATPLPPLNLKNTGQLCPMIQASPAIRTAHGS